jgi:Rdx family protein
MSLIIRPLPEAGPGALDVFIDRQKIYSKRQTGRLPTADEIIELIRNRG